MTYTQLFLRFLKQNNIFHLFVHNAHNVNEKDYHYNLNDIDNISPTSFIMHAFMWCKTKEGEMFWRDINIKWIKYIMEKINNENVNDYQIYLYIQKLKGNNIIYIKHKKENNK